jgi:hypothetical protein
MKQTNTVKGGDVTFNKFESKYASNMKLGSTGNMLKISGLRPVAKYKIFTLFWVVDNAIPTMKMEH